MKERWSPSFLRWEDVASWRTFTATVTSGKGTLGTKGSPREGRSKEIEAVTGLRKVPGSLNVRTTRRVWLRPSLGAEWGEGRLYPGRVAGVDVVFRKLENRLGASPHLLHAYADRHLRSELDLRDGALVEILLPAAAVSRPWTLASDALYALRLLRRWVADRHRTGDADDHPSGT